MDIAAMSIAYSQAKVQQAASISVAKMAMNTAKSNGDALTRMLDSSAKSVEQAAYSHLGGNIDVRV